jgi:hypothetical protein
MAIFLFAGIQIKILFSGLVGGDIFFCGLNENGIDSSR